MRPIASDDEGGANDPWKLDHDIGPSARAWPRAPSWRCSRARRPVAAQDDAIPAGLPRARKRSIAAAGRTQDASFCGTEPITLGIYDGVGINAWSQASFAAADQRGRQVPQRHDVGGRRRLRPVEGHLRPQRVARPGRERHRRSSPTPACPAPSSRPSSRRRPMASRSCPGVPTRPAPPAPTTSPTSTGTRSTRVASGRRGSPMRSAARATSCSSAASPATPSAMQQLQGINEVFADNPDITLLTGNGHVRADELGSSGRPGER